MSFKVKRLTVGKGKTVEDEKAGEWVRSYYEMEIEIEDERVLELAKESVEAVLDAWLSGETITPEKPKPKYDIEKIHWQSAEGFKGPYERSEDVNSLDFKMLLKDVQEHGGKMAVGEYFVWALPNGATLGRKRRNQNRK